MSRRALIVLVLVAAGVGGCAGAGGRLMAEEGMPTSVPGRFAEADAVVLHDVGWVHHHAYLAQRGLPIPFVFTRWTRVRIQKEAAAAPERFGVFRVIHLDKLLEAQAQVKKVDGRVVPLGPDAIQTAVLQREYYPGLEPPFDLHETRFTFPGLQAGDTLEVRTTQVDWPPSWTFQRRDVPVLLSRIIVTRPNADIDLLICLFDPGKIVDPVEEATLTGSAQTGGSEEQLAWTARDLPPLAAGAFLPPAVARLSRLDMQLVARGVQLGEWAQAYRRWLFLDGACPDALAARARELTAGAADDAERARRLLAFVHEEVATRPDLGLTWIWPAKPPQPPHPERWLAEKQGTPEQVLGLLAALLQGAGVKPTLVLTADEESPMLSEGNQSLEQLTRALLALPDGTLIDPGERFQALGKVAPELQGRPALWVAPDKAWFAKLPEPPAAENALEVQLEGRLSAEGEAEGEARMTLRGLPARDLRAWLASAAPDAVKAELPGRLVLGWGPSAVVEELRVDGAEDPGKPLQLTLRFRLPGLVSRQGERQVVRVGALWPRSLVPAMSEAERSQPVWLPMALVEGAEVILELPRGMEPAEMPKGLRTEPAAAGQAMSVEAELSYSSAEGLLRMGRRIGVNQRAFGAEFYPILRAVTTRYLGAADDLFAMQPAKAGRR